MSSGVGCSFVLAQKFIPCLLEQEPDKSEIRQKSSSLASFVSEVPIPCRTSKVKEPRSCFLSPYKIAVTIIDGHVMQMRSHSHLLLFFLFSSVSWITISMAEPTNAQSAVHIVYTERPESDDLESFHLRTLSSVLGRFDPSLFPWPDQVRYVFGLVFFLSDG